MRSEWRCGPRRVTTVISSRQISVSGRDLVAPERQEPLESGPAGPLGTHAAAALGSSCLSARMKCQPPSNARIPGNPARLARSARRAPVLPAHGRVGLTDPRQMVECGHGSSMIGCTDSSETLPDRGAELASGWKPPRQHGRRAGPPQAHHARCRLARSARASSSTAREASSAASRGSTVISGCSPKPESLYTRSLSTMMSRMASALSTP